jgi:hypothetical protein
LLRDLRTGTWKRRGYARLIRGVIHVAHTSISTFSEYLEPAEEIMRIS